MTLLSIPQESPSQRTNPASASYQHTSQPGFSQTRHFEPSTTQSGEQNHPHQDGLDQVSASAHSFSGHGQEPPHSSHDSQPASSGHPSYSVSSSDSFGAAPGTHAEARSEQVPEPQLGVRAPQVEDRQPEPPQITMHSWDAQRSVLPRYHDEILTTNTRVGILLLQTLNPRRQTSRRQSMPCRKTRRLSCLPRDTRVRPRTCGITCPRPPLRRRPRSRAPSFPGKITGLGHLDLSRAKCTTLLRP